MYGWAGQRLKVYLTEGKIVREETPEWLRKEYIGGRGFNSRTLFDEVVPGTDPLSPENVLIVGASLFAGTLAPCAARWTVTAKAPLTGIHGDGNGGGTFAAELKFAGYDQIIFYGRSPKPVYLWIHDDRVELRDASRLWGKTTWDTTNDLIIKELGDKRISVLTIGPGGENLVRFAKVYNDKARAGGKGGMGAVMGSKNLKAVAVKGNGATKIADPEGFYQAARHAYEKLKASPFQQMIGKKGTLFLMRKYAEIGALPVNNCQSGYLEGWGNLTSETLEANYAVRHKGCFGCPTACTYVYRVKEGPYATYGYACEYGTTYPFSSKIGSDNLAAALKLCTLCDQLGLDTHSCGGTISFAMEAWQKGLISAKDTDGLDLKWGNVDAVIELVRKIAYREGFGNLLAEGSKIASTHIAGTDGCLYETKGMECSSYFPGPEETKTTALAFATAPIGGSLHRGGSGVVTTITSDRIKKALGEELARKAANPWSYEGQGIALAIDNNFNAMLNCLGCLVLCGAHKQALVEDDLSWLFSAATGIQMDGEELLRAGERIFTVEKAFNLREGMGRKDDTLPERCFVEKPGQDHEDTIGINRIAFEAMLDEYYKFRGWDQEGFPSEEKLKELNLMDMAQQLRDLRTTA